MTTDSPKNMCPVCGYEDLHDPAYDARGHSSFEICPCCGTEFGYDDFSSAHDGLRQKWIENGKKWWSTTTKHPEDWNPDAQLSAAGLE